jgi:uncharacterized protein involved in exopolysaccharide biosynthesis
MLSTLWRFKWWIVLPSAVMLAATMLWSRYFLPKQYQASTVIQIVPPGTSIAVALPSRTVSERLTELSQIVLSRTRLEPLLTEFHIYADETPAQPIEQMIERLRRDVFLSLRRDDDQGVAGFTVSFTSAEPTTAMRVTDRIASMFIQENVRRTAVLSDSGVQFVTARIEEMRVKVNGMEAEIGALTRSGKPIPRAQQIEYEILQETLRTLLVRQQELMNSDAAVRRMIGEQFKVIDGARIPTKPIGPDRVAVNVAGGVVGLGVGLLLAWMRGSRRRPLAATEEASC